jgi:hypothetical protein
VQEVCRIAGPPVSPKCARNCQPALLKRRRRHDSRPVEGLKSPDTGNRPRVDCVVVRAEAVSRVVPAAG